MFGKMMSERLGKIHFWITVVAFNVTFFPMHIIGMAAHPRRIAFAWDSVNNQGYAFLKHVQYLNVVMTVGALALGVAQLVFFYNFFHSVFKGEKATANPWNAATLEWCAAESPPPHLNWGPTVPVVYNGPYEYSSPLAGDKDWIPQTQRPEGA